MTTPITLVPGEAVWRSRKVRYYAGDWAAIQSLLPHFDLVPFSAGDGEPGNPHLQTVMRRPLMGAERPIPVGVVSHTYMLAQHHEVAALCRKGLIDAGIDADGLTYEVGLSELGEWMNLRIYLPQSSDFKKALGDTLRLRLECTNAVDGWSRLMILFGWLRLVCTNGMVISETKLEIKEKHGGGLDLDAISSRIPPALVAALSDRDRLRLWQSQTVALDAVSEWANAHVSNDWGKKAATRVFHICTSGRDVEITDPFAKGEATEKPVRHLAPVPGSPAPAANKYDVSQAMSFVATGRKDAEERIAWQSDIPRLLSKLTSLQSV